MNNRPDVFKPITDEQLRALSEKNGWVGKERGVEPEEVDITAEMMRDAVAPTTQKTNLDALRAFITPSTAAQARERDAADERDSMGQLSGYGEDPTPLDQFLQEQGLKPISDEQHAAIAAAEPATRGAVVDSLLDEPDAQDAAFLEEERKFLEQRDASVTDAQLIERMNAAPDMGGSILAEHTQRAAEPLNTWLLPPNPGPFGKPEQWQAWRQELLALGPETAGVDVELQIADKVIASMQGGPQ
jgi:hypothetical protein